MVVERFRSRAQYAIAACWNGVSDRKYKVKSSFLAEVSAVQVSSLEAPRAIRETKRLSNIGLPDASSVPRVRSASFSVGEGKFNRERRKRLCSNSCDSPGVRRPMRSTTPNAERWASRLLAGCAAASAIYGSYTQLV